MKGNEMEANMSDLKRSLFKNVVKRRGVTVRQWKSIKRKEVDIALKALSDARLGCAYMPDYHEFTKACELLRQYREKLTVKNWGR